MFHNADEFQALYPHEEPAPAIYCAPRRDQGIAFDSARRRIALRAGLLRSADAPRSGPLQGSLDHVGARSLVGWAQNTENPQAPVCLDIFNDGRLIGRALANRYRADLKTAGFGNGCCGFSFIPPAGISLVPGRVEVRRSLDGARFGGTVTEAA